MEQLLWTAGGILQLHKLFTMGTNCETSFQTTTAEQPHNTPFQLS